MKKAVGRMLSLKDREWAVFRFDEIFTSIQRGKRFRTADHITGLEPYVSSTSTNNGINAFISNDKRARTFRDCLTVANSGSIGSTFYHRYGFIASDHVTQLKSPHFGKYIYLFLSPVIARLSEKYSFNREISDKRIKKERLLLPVDKLKAPDWQFMQSYVREREQSQLEEYIDYAKKVLTDIGYVEEVLLLKEKEWKPFMLSDIFDIRVGKRLTRADMRIGSRPFIGATDANNGITGFVSNNNISLDSNVLGVNYNGSVVDTFYHPYECIFSDDVKRFFLKITAPNRYLYLFLKTAIVQQKVKYAYGYKFNEKRMKKQLLLLPVKFGTNEPDWAYMEQYAKVITKQQLMAYLNQKV